MSSPEKKKSPPQTKTIAILWRSLKYLKPYWKLTLGIYAAMLVLNAINLAMPQFIRWVIDKGIYGNDLDLLTYAVLGLLGMTAAKGVIDNGRIVERDEHAQLLTQADLYRTLYDQQFLDQE